MMKLSAAGNRLIALGGIRKMQRHFDDLIRFTRVHAHESADYVRSLQVP